MPTALIDGDIVAYQVAVVCEKPAKFDGTGGGTFEEREVKRTLRLMLDNWTRLAKCSARVVLITGNLNFRKLVDPTYKSHRGAKPVALEFAKATMVEEHGALMVNGLEADDLIGLMLTGSMADGRGVAVSIDKDLRTIPGLHLNPNHKPPKVDTVTTCAADHYWMTQTLTGDATDGYSGAKGIGPAKAKTTLGNAAHWPMHWPKVVKAFESVGMTREDALRNARLARILRTGDYDKETRTVRLWRSNGSDPLCLDDLLQSPTDSGPASPIDQKTGVGCSLETPARDTPASGPATFVNTLTGSPGG